MPGPAVFKPRIVRYLDKQGKRVKKGTPGARKVKVKARKYHGRYWGADGRMKRVPLCADKAAARQMLADLVRAAEREKAGLSDPRLEESAQRPLAEHLEDYRRHLQAKNDDPRHVSQVISHCKAIFEGTGARFIPDLDAGKVEGWLEEQRRSEPRFGISTSNHYLTSAKGFTRWLTRCRPPRWASDPLANLSRLGAEVDVRRKRRPLLADEAARLLQAAHASAKVFRGLTGEDRHFLYAIALQTGFRAGELASRTPRSFALDGTVPTAKVAAGYTKDGEEAVQPLPRELAEALRPWLDSKPADRPLWPGTWHKRAFKMIEHDLAAARAAWLAEADSDEEKRKRREGSGYLAYANELGTADFHATRHSYITLLAKSGVHPKMAQDLARHSTINLTMNYYTHLRLHDRAAALEALPSLLTVPTTAPAHEALAATGTDGPMAQPPEQGEHLVAPRVAPLSPGSCRDVSGPARSKGEKKRSQKRRNPQ